MKKKTASILSALSTVFKLNFELTTDNEIQIFTLLKSSNIVSFCHAFNFCYKIIMSVHNNNNVKSQQKKSNLVHVV